MASTMRSLARGLISPVVQEKIEVKHEVIAEPTPTPAAEVPVLEPELPSITEIAAVDVAAEEVFDVPPTIEVPQDISVVEKKPEKKSKPKPSSKKVEKVTNQKKVNPPPPETET